MTQLPHSDLLDHAALMFTSARKNLMQGAALLSKIRAEGLYKPLYETFSEYLEQHVKISEGFASKLVVIYEAYVLEGGVKQETIDEVDSEKLYLALRLPGTFAEKVTKADLLTRSELKAELSEKNGVDCLHPTKITICAKCHQRVE